MRALGLFALVALLYGAPAGAKDASNQSPLPNIGPAPGIVLISQTGSTFNLADLRDRVVLVSFFYTWCSDICPTLMNELTRLQDSLGTAFGKDIVFLSITFDPERDTVEVLRDYAEAFGADPDGWFFLTGELLAVREVVRNYGVVTVPAANGAIEHNLLTSLVDNHGNLRVQYAGIQFDPEELQMDLTTLMAER